MPKSFVAVAFFVLAWPAQVLAQPGAPTGATCKGVAAVQAAAARLREQGVALRLALASDAKSIGEATAQRDAAIRMQARTALLGYALANDIAPPTGDKFMQWPVKQLDDILVACELSFASQLKRAQVQRWVLLSGSRASAAFAVDFNSLRSDGQRRSLTVATGLAQPVGDKPSRMMKAFVHGFSFTCGQPITMVQTIELGFNANLKQISQTLGAETSSNVTAGSPSASFQRIACGIDRIDPAAQKATTIAQAVRLVSDKAGSGQ